MIDDDDIKLENYIEKIKQRWDIIKTKTQEVVLNKLEEVKRNYQTHKTLGRLYRDFEFNKLYIHIEDIIEIPSSDGFTTELRQTKGRHYTMKKQVIVEDLFEQSIDFEDIENIKLNGIEQPVYDNINSLYGIVFELAKICLKKMVYVILDDYQILKDDSTEFKVNHTFNQNHFEEIMTLNFDLLFNNTIAIDFIYPILNVELEITETIQTTKNITLQKIETKDKNQLLANLYPNYLNQYDSLLDLLWLYYCKQWIKIPIKISSERLGKNVFLDGYSVLKREMETNLLNEHYLEEAFSLLSDENIKTPMLYYHNQFLLRPFDINLSNYKLQIIMNSDKYFMTQNPQEAIKIRFLNHPKMLFERDALDFVVSYHNSIISNNLSNTDITIHERLNNGIKSLSINDKIIDITIGIETLLVEGSEQNSLQFRIKIAHLLSISIEHKLLFYEVAKLIYSVRSHLVHEGGVELNKKLKKIGGRENFELILNHITKLIILRLIVYSNNKNKLISHNELKQYHEQLLLGFNIPIEEHEFYRSRFKKFILLMSSIKGE